jgi:outer membrane protein TolC
VADSLRALEFDAITLRAQADAELAARETLEITQEQFRLGAVSSLALLIAQRLFQEARISLVQARAARYADTAALFQSLGGGWWNREPRTETVASSESN